jgi:hypothetical protein
VKPVVVEVWLAAKATVTIEPGSVPEGSWNFNPASVKEHVLSEYQAAARMEERRTGVKTEFVVDHVTTTEAKEQDNGTRA